MPTSWLDRAALRLSPSWGLNRIRARARAEAIMGFEAARMPLRDRFRDRDGGPNDEVGNALAVLRRRSRALVRDNPYAKKILLTLAGHQVGYGIRPRATTDDKPTNKRFNAAFTEWAKKGVIGGQLDYFGGQHQAAWARGESGEALVRAVRLSSREMRDRGMKVPLQIEIVEADLLADGLSASGNPLGPRVVHGVSFDRRGNRDGYWFRGSHPGEGTMLRYGDDARFWPAADVVHLQRAYADRPGTVRGIPDLTPSITRLYRLDDYEVAAIEQARAAALTGIIWETADGEADMQTGKPGGGAGEGQDTGGADVPVEMYPGMIGSAPAGSKAHYLQPAGAGPFEPFVGHGLRAIAAGAGCTYDQATGDLRAANYSSMRGGRAEFRRVVEDDQYLMIIPQMCDPVVDWFTQMAMAAGVLEEGDYPVTHMPPRIELIDPSQDVPALRSMRRLGLQTWGQQVMEQGFDPDEQMEEIRRENADFDERGIILDGDPRRMSLSGGANDPKQNAAIEIAATGAASPRPQAPTSADPAAQGAPPVVPFRPRRAS
ncbi:phage portal protein [Roseomonas populi]|uniref:Phage portal protein n=1 Tax=Roseomonas populi TaxID=3121582 RepID=A0ABT1X4A7_9PROT|nr:phage portal protein [Roseomonas pecuniae]MCR0981799.1 phage portal protein [Roseomonas pecuniae]